MPDHIRTSTSNLAMLHRSFPDLSEVPWQRAEREQEAVYGGIGGHPDRAVDGTVS